MTQSCNLISSVAVAACASVSGITSFGASRGSYDCFVAVAQRCNLIGSVAVAACAGVSGVTSFGAGRGSYNCIVAVAKSGNLFLHGQPGLTVRAVLTCGVTRIGTSGRLSFAGILI